jgi:hypothetical protein
MFKFHIKPSYCMYLWSMKTEEARNGLYCFADGEVILVLLHQLQHNIISEICKSVGAHSVQQKSSTSNPPCPKQRARYAYTWHHNSVCVCVRARMRACAHRHERARTHTHMHMCIILRHQCQMGLCIFNVNYFSYGNIKQTWCTYLSLYTQ